MVNELRARPVELKPHEFERIRVDPRYYHMGYSKEERVFLQEEAKEKLVDALRELPEEYGFIVWDAYRSREVQAVMFDWMLKQVKAQEPHLSDDQIYETAKKYMSPPSKVGDEYCPPHLSGGAIDLTLFDVRTGREECMGTPFDDCTDRAHAMFYERQKVLTSEEMTVRENRRVLRNVMLGAGFTYYKYEWWHFDYGNVFWSNMTGCPQVFGPLFGNFAGPRML